MLALVLVWVCAATVANTEPSVGVAALADGSVDLGSVFGDVTAAEGFRYDLKDSSGNQMACCHVFQADDTSAWSGSKYFATYHAMVGKEYQVRLARSSDLMTWTFVRTLINNADMPFMSRPTLAASNQNSQWILLAHEQWMTVRAHSCIVPPTCILTISAALPPAHNL